MNSNAVVWMQVKEILDVFFLPLSHSRISIWLCPPISKYGVCNIARNLLCPHHDSSVFKILHQRWKPNLTGFLNIVLIPWHSTHTEWVNMDE